MSSDYFNNSDWRPPFNPNHVSPPKVFRPNFSLTAMILDFFIPYGLIVYGCYIMLDVFSSRTVILVSFCYLLLRTKRILLWLLLLYQRFAAEDIRNSCSFTPSCSEYMFISINKYGVLPGMIKGINRLLRCRGVNNGEDNP